MSDAQKYPWLAAVATAFALTIAGAWQTAHAATPSGTGGAAIDQPKSRETHRAMTECKTLPLSDRGICADQAGYGQKVMMRSPSANQQAAVDRENARYKAAMKECGRMPVSDRGICASQAGDDRKLAAME